MKEIRVGPHSLRVNEDDKKVLTYLQGRLGLEMTQLFKQGIRALRDKEKRAEKE